MKTLLAIAVAAAALSLPSLALAQSIKDIGGRESGPTPPEAQMPHPYRHMGGEHRRDRGAHYRI